MKRMAALILVFCTGWGSCSGSYEASDVEVTDPSPIQPSSEAEITVTATNSGSAKWKKNSVELVYTGDPAFDVEKTKLSNDTSPGQIGTWNVEVEAPAAEGTFHLSWDPVYKGVVIGPPVELDVVVTCSDGLFCNGTERLTVGGDCVASVAPCVDDVDCTVDSCDEATKLCSYQLGPDCDTCVSDCTPECTGRVCGDDGCGGSCGDCGAGEACAAAVGSCEPEGGPGTCAGAIPLLAVGTPLLGQHLVEGDTSAGVHSLVPTCNDTSTAVELVYSFEVTSTVGMDARSYGYDTVLFLRKDDPGTPDNECDSNDADIACSDDASPPGDYGSRLAVALDPGTYYLIVDGYDYTQYGPFSLSVNFVDNGCVPQCDGLYCGGSDGCGGDCGSCDVGEACVEGRCELDPCVPDCSGKECGDDGCGNSCGSCPDGELCVDATSTCDSFPACDHAAPVCSGCTDDQFCGSDCACHSPGELLPDLVVDVGRLADDVLFTQENFTPESCAIVEQCIDAPGLRDLVRFSVQVLNQGWTTLEVPAPDTRPDLFEYSACHGHYHYVGFATYELLDLDGNTVLTGRKQAYCMEDTAQGLFSPAVSCDKAYDCDTQGIQPGWFDLYGNSLDCQWLDVTDVAPGDYILRVVANPGRAFQEGSWDNNTAEVQLTIAP